METKKNLLSEIQAVALRPKNKPAANIRKENSKRRSNSYRTLFSARLRYSGWENQIAVLPRPNATIRDRLVIPAFENLFNSFFVIGKGKNAHHNMEVGISNKNKRGR